MDYIQEPPPAYVRPYTGRLHLIEQSAAQVEQSCRVLGVRGSNALACALLLTVGGRDCVVFLPIVGRGGVGRSTRAALERHEINGHCNGWPKEHPSK